MNQKNLLIAIATLIVAIFAFAQVYIIFTVTTINDRINSLDQRLTHLETRFDKRFTELEPRFDKRFTAIDQRFTDLETRMDQRFTDLETRFDKRFNLIETRLDALNQNYIDHLAHHIDK